MKFETNYNLKERKDYHCSSDSMTVPDQALSLKDLLTKYTHGIAPAVEQRGSYENDGDDFDDINPLRVPGVDIVDINELSADISDKLNKAHSIVKDKAEKAKIEALRKEWEASVAKTKDNEDNSKK